mmetsp:Transcript_26334/g.12383  ORF Transcript_26334/g.12383 Transcript_26334/m.12383 type:complete len:93 (+) Transcript_26334:1482-1760(+)
MKNCFIIFFQYFVRDNFYLINYFRKFSTDKSFCRKNSIFWICHSLTLCNKSNNSLFILGKSDHRRCCSISFKIGYHNRFSSFHHTNAGVCCS